MARLSQAHKHILIALAQGKRLQDHRDLDGGKVYKLHTLDSTPDEVVVGSLVLDLQHQQLIQSNLKFPAATYRLTDKGAALAATLCTDETA
ncbi:MAG: hypothetical protein U0350_29600 [Caldilineaceae bacterium]